MFCESGPELNFAHCLRHVLQVSTVHMRLLCKHLLLELGSDGEFDLQRKQLLQKGLHDMGIKQRH